MRRHYLLTIILLLTLTAPPALATRLPAATLTGSYATDDEYDRYRKEGDDLFKIGRYDEARRKYRNCLALPGFETDEYATRRVELTTRLLTLLQQADQAVQQQNDTVMVNRLTSILALNPPDPVVNGRLADFYLTRGNEFFQQKEYVTAKTQYQQGLAYAQTEGNRTKISTLDLQIRNSDTRLADLETERNRYYTPKRTVLKLLTGVLAVGSGYYAYSLQQDFTARKAELAAATLITDPDGDGIVNTPDEYQRYNAAYTAAQAAQEKRGLYVACLSVAAAATLTELYLLVRKAKPRPRAGLHLTPAPTGYGLALGYRF